MRSFYFSASDFFSGSKKFFGFILISAVFVSSLFLSSCAKKVEGAGSASVAPSTNEIVPLLLYDYQSVAEGKAEEDRDFRFGLGAANLRPYLIFSYKFSDSLVGLGVGGVIFSGLSREYNVGTSDLSYIKRWISGKSSLLAFGIGLGGAYATDYNFSREGKRTYLGEAHIYGQMYISTKIPDSNFGFFFNFRLGGFFLESPVIQDISQELSQSDKNIRVKKSISGLLFIPSFGFNWTMIDNKVIGYAGLVLPLSAFLLFEPDLHPYVPSLNFAFVF